MCSSTWLRPRAASIHCPRSGGAGLRGVRDRPRSGVQSGVPARVSAFFDIYVSTDQAAFQCGRRHSANPRRRSRGRRAPVRFHSVAHDARERGDGTAGGGYDDLVPAFGLTCGPPLEGFFRSAGSSVPAVLGTVGPSGTRSRVDAHRNTTWRAGVTAPGLSRDFLRRCGSGCGCDQGRRGSRSRRALVRDVAGGEASWCWPNSATGRTRSASAARTGPPATSRCPSSWRRWRWQSGVEHGDLPAAWRTAGPRAGTGSSGVGWRI